MSRAQSFRLTRPVFDSILPWQIPQLARRIPYQIAIAYLVLAGLFLALSFQKTSRRIPE